MEQTTTPIGKAEKPIFAKSERRTMRRRPQREAEEFDQVMIDLARVTRVMAGGKRMRFRSCMVIGDRKGRVGWGIAKGADVSMAIQKATAQAKKNMITVSIVEGTIPHDVQVKFKAARLLLKPAKTGKGLIAGGVVRTVLELAGVQNIISKMFGSSNKINNVAATFKALSQLRRVDTPAPKSKNNDEAVEARTTAPDMKKPSRQAKAK